MVFEKLEDSRKEPTERGESQFGPVGGREGAMPSLEARYWADGDAEACESEEGETRSISGSGSGAGSSDDENAMGETFGSVPLWPQSYR